MLVSLILLKLSNEASSQTNCFSEKDIKLNNKASVYRQIPKYQLVPQRLDCIFKHKSQRCLAWIAAFCVDLSTLN